MKSCLDASSTVNPPLVVLKLRSFQHLLVQPIPKRSAFFKFEVARHVESSASLTSNGRRGLQPITFHGSTVWRTQRTVQLGLGKGCKCKLLAGS